jgi:hypothetical protein
VCRRLQRAWYDTVVSVRARVRITRSMIGVEPPRPDGKARGGRIPVGDPRSNAASAGWIGAENDRLIHSRALGRKPNPALSRVNLRRPRRYRHGRYAGRLASSPRIDAWITIRGQSVVWLGKSEIRGRVAERSATGTRGKSGSELSWCVARDAELRLVG